MKDRMSLLDSLVRAHQARLRAYLFSRTGDIDAADDLAQEVFLVVFRLIDQYDSARPAWPWLMGIARNELRVGAYAGRTTASIRVGDPGFPELRGAQTGAELRWRVDTQDSPVVPSGGWLSHVQLSHIFNGPDIVVAGQTVDADSGLTQLSAVANRFWSFGPSNRVFVYGGAGISFDDKVLPTNQFALGTPFRLGAYGAGELRGNHYYVATGGYLRRVGRLPDRGAGQTGRQVPERVAAEHARHAEKEILGELRALCVQTS
jgi:hypothetical protein